DPGRDSTSTHSRKLPTGQGGVMTDGNGARDAADPHDLNRFVQAQEDDYNRALAEIKSGRKRSHWMWYIFPQFEGLGSSATCPRRIDQGNTTTRRSASS